MKKEEWLDRDIAKWMFQNSLDEIIISKKRWNKCNIIHSRPQQNSNCHWSQCVQNVQEYFEMYPWTNQNYHPHRIQSVLISWRMLIPINLPRKVRGYYTTIDEKYLFDLYVMTYLLLSTISFILYVSILSKLTMFTWLFIVYFKSMLFNWCLTLEYIILLSALKYGGIIHLNQCVSLYNNLSSKLLFLYFYLSLSKKYSR